MERLRLGGWVGGVITGKDLGASGLASSSQYGRYSGI